MENNNNKEQYCPHCGKVDKAPFCCTKEMTVDTDVFFCALCGKEIKVQICCGERMIVRDRITV